MERFSPGQLLDPRYEAVPFHGRTAELAALAGWRDHVGPLSVLLLHGPAGVGKTRLAHHFTDRVDHADTAVTVVDDADLVPWHELYHLLQEPIANSAGRARVLLVARTTGWWWSALRQRAADLDFDTADLALAPRPKEHAESYASACAHFAALLDLPPPAAPAPDAETVHDLHLAALAAVHGSSATDRVELVRWLMSAEPAAPTTRRLAEDALAVALLDERITPERSPDALETVLRALPRWPHLSRRVEELFTAEPELAATATSATLRELAELDSTAPARAVARHVFNDARFHCDPLPAVLTRTLLREGERTAGPLELAELYGMLGARAALASLHEEALDAARREVALYRELVGADPAEHRSALADALGDLGLRLIAVGRTEEALEVSEEAVALCRVVATQDEDYAPQLAAALEQLSLRYAALGRRDEAMTAISKASLLYQGLAKQHPALFRVDFAKVSHHLAVRLFDVGREEEAAHAAQWAVVHWRAAAQTDPRYEPDFARTLATLASLLSAFRRPDDAVVVLEESIAVLRRLADANPRDFEPELATALAVLGTMLRRADRSPEALKASEEAVLVRRRLARDGDPEARALLAAALGDQVDVLRGPERLVVAEEAVELLRSLAVRFPVGHRVDFAIAQARLARLLLDAGRDHEARRIVDEVLSVERRLPRRLLAERGAKLASALHLLSDDLTAVEHHESALRLAEQVVDIWRDLLGHSRAAPVAYAVAVHRTAVLMRGMGREGTHARARLAVLVWQLTRTPEELATEPAYAETLSFHARLCAETGVDLDRALVLAHRAVLVLRAGGAGPDRFLRAVEAVDEVVRAHADPESARARVQAMMLRDWASSVAGERAGE